MHPSKKANTNEDEDAIIKRNNTAPGFPPSIIRNRSQLLIERYMQVASIDLQSYIDDQRILKLEIPILTLKDWYPTPNWKKDIKKLCSDLFEIRFHHESPNGDFDYMSLLSRSKLDDKGLHLTIDPEVLKYYVLTPEAHSSSLDYNLTNKFKISYSYQIYWLMVINDVPEEKYRFYLTPEKINEMFETKYHNKNIVDKILIPTQNDIKGVYEQGFSPRFFTYEERREVVGKCKKIVGWEIIIHNEARTRRYEIASQEAYREIDILLKKYLPKFRINVLAQVRVFDAEKILNLRDRLQKFNNDPKDQIGNITGYITAILQTGYGIKPRSSKVEKDKIETSFLFSKEEKDTNRGIEYWGKCKEHIENTTELTVVVKDLFKTLRFYSYTETEDHSELTLSTSKQAYDLIENSNEYIQCLRLILLKYFPANIRLQYVCI